MNLSTRKTQLRMARDYWKTSCNQPKWLRLKRAKDLSKRIFTNYQPYEYRHFKKHPWMENATKKAEI